MRKQIAAVLLVGASAAHAEDPLQPVREEFQAALNAGELGAAYAALLNFGSEPDIATGVLRIDDSGLARDARLGAAKLPLRFEFPSSDHDWTPFTQVTLGKLALEQAAETPDNGRVEAEWKSSSVSGGGGVMLPLAPGWNTSLGVEAGYARLKNNARYTGEFANEFLKPIFKGSALDWKTDAWLASAHLGLEYSGKVDRLDLEAKLGGTVSHISSFNEETEFQEFSENIGTLSAQLEAAHPLGVNVAGYPLSIAGHLTGNTFVGNDRDVLGFTYLVGLGSSLQLDISRHDKSLSRISLGGMLLRGDDVKGWAIRIGYRY
jgi:hypothetical protein